MPNTHAVELIGQEVVAEHLGVTSQAISNWYARGLEGMPKPTLIEYKPGKPPIELRPLKGQRCRHNNRRHGQN